LTGLNTPGESKIDVIVVEWPVVIVANVDEVERVIVGSIVPIALQCGIARIFDFLNPYLGFWLVDDACPNLRIDDGWGDDWIHCSERDATDDTAEYSCSEFCGKGIFVRRGIDPWRKPDQGSKEAPSHETDQEGCRDR
jgi:hypothetical protein